jgi:peptidoglycan/LPS O-acetylase OafA/YrhL
MERIGTRERTVKHLDIKAETTYRPDIDGLRCIAVLLVVAFHLFPKAVRGGFIGVDIFFVISGYLITSILFGSMRKSTYSILTFYERRVRRIFPALIVVLVATFTVGWFVLSPEELTSLGQTLIGGASFSANLVLLQQIGYFDIASESKPLLHLWSLGVEEQFYIAWPLILYAAYKRKLNLLTLVCAIMLGSFALNIALVKGQPDRVFYLPFTRAWELGAGVFLVFLREAQGHPAIVKFSQRVDNLLAAIVWDLKRDPQPRNIASDLRAITGLVLIVIGALSLTSRTPFPGFAALLPVIGAALIISAENAVINRRVLSSTPFVFLGLISYPLYLWHYPLIAYARLLNDQAPGWPVQLGIAAASILLAWLTYHLVEKPIRFGRLSQTRIFQLCSAMVVLAIVGGGTVYEAGFESRVPETIRAYVAANRGDETSAYWRRGSCLLLPDQDASSFGAECTSETKRPLVVIWGDSYAAAMYAGLKSLQADIHFGLAELTASACPPAIGFIHPQRQHCKGINDAVAQKIAQLRPDIVLLHSTWMYDRGALESSLNQTVITLRSLGIKRIVFVGPVPSWRGRSLPQNLVDYYMMDPSHPLLPARTRFRLFASEELNNEMREIARRLNVEFISALDEMCNAAGCLARVGDHPGDLTAFDSGHLTIPGSSFLARAMKDKLFPNCTDCNNQ